MKHKVLFALSLCLLLLAGLQPLPLTAESFADGAFETVWQRTDQPLAAGRVARSWMWGPEPFTGALNEPYAEAPGGTRLVQYFEKSRMEINDPSSDRGSSWFVTNGLLVREMVDGRVQTGDTAFETRAPARETVAGDAVAVNIATCPTYASFTYLTWDRAEDRRGQPVTATLVRDGTVGDDPSKADYAGTQITYYDETTGHNVPQALWEMMNQRGLVYSNGGYRTDQVVDWLFAMGYPISEPYWVRCNVAGEEKDILVQLFERRVLTYTPSNPAGWQVEMGNVGLHYYNWRYGAGGAGQPAVYTFEDKCVKILLQGKTYVDWCLESVEVEADGQMKYNVSWTAHIYGYPWAHKKSDEGNRNMLLVDNLGNRYDHVEVGGAAYEVYIRDGETVRGWFLFPPAAPGATVFAFYDNDNGVQIGDIVLQR